jgi:transcriptional regulator with XRE-family HTH domain
MTQADLARLSQVTVSYVSRLESGQIAPGIDLVERIAKAMAIAVHELLPGKGEPNPLPLLHEQAQKMLSSLIRTGNAEAFTRLNPILALILESASRRG